MISTEKGMLHRPLPRRNFLALAIGLLLGSGCRPRTSRDFEQGPGVLINDVHSQLNLTRVRNVESPVSSEALREIVARARDAGQKLSVAGYRHAMGGQQFASDSIHIDTRHLQRIYSFDRSEGVIEVDAGIAWPQLIDYLLQEQEGAWPQWGITQKQTGADNLTIGGSISANAHGRGVRFQPLIQDIESLELINAEGEIVYADRRQNRELFSLAVGGYSLFGLISKAKMRLSRRRKLERTVEVVHIEDLPELARERVASGFLYGDFQYKTDSSAADFMKVGVFSTYRPVADDTPIAAGQKELAAEDWNKLLYLAFRAKKDAFDAYSQYYLTTNGQIYWSDTHQLSYYDPQYRSQLIRRDRSLANSTLMITEVYVPIEHFISFTNVIAETANAKGLDIIYGTMRLIRKDHETFLPWAKEDYVCIIFNLHVEDTPQGLERASQQFQYLIDLALERGGSYFLTYHRFARKDQVLQAYPQFVEFLRKKREYDPEELFQSEWYRHYRNMFADELGV